MLNKIMWNIFRETGNIYAYLYINEHDKCLNECNEYLYYNKNEGNGTYTDKSLRINGITIMT